MNYCVHFNIDVDAPSPQEAVKYAWGLLSAPDSFKPVGEAYDAEGNRTTVDLQAGVDECVTDDNDACPCGSGLEGEAEYDARGIYLCRCCEKCREEKLKVYRPEVLSDPGYECDEPIEPEDY